MRNKPSFSNFIPLMAAALIAAATLLPLAFFPKPALAEPLRQDELPPPTPLPNPLENPLPRPGLDPVAAWRPPLYPVPWSLNEFDHFYFVRPLPANTVNWPLSAYSYGATNFDPDKPHTGVDIVVDEGTPVYAAGRGQVIWTGYGLFLGGRDESDPYGLSVAIQHDFGYEGEPLFTVYAHLSEIKVSRGQIVEAGELIALSGNTGLSTAPHLHFEVRMGINHFYNSYNPVLWTSPPQGWGLLVGRVTTTWNNLVHNQVLYVINLDTNESWSVNTYGSDRLINPDPYYKENWILGDLEAGTYKIQIPYVGYWYTATVEVFPGAVTYFHYQGFNGFRVGHPPIAIPDSVPEVEP